MYRKAKVKVVVMLILSTLVFLAGVLYLALSRRFDIYDWRYGLLSVGLIFLSLSVFSVYFREFYALFLAPRCPRCDGVIQMSVVEVRGKTVFGKETLPPIRDKVIKCTLCQGEHHHIYAQRDEANTIAPIHLGDSWMLAIHDRASRMRWLRPAMTDEEIVDLYAKWDSHPKRPETTRAEWEAMLERLQQEARSKNIESGMVFPNEKT